MEAAAEIAQRLQMSIFIIWVQPASREADAGMRICFRQGTAALR
jgi:hypothetical protein